MQLVRLRAALSALLISVLAVLGITYAAGASAHGMLDGTSPSDGSVVAVMPPSVVMLFNEPVTLPPEPVRIVDSTGQSISLGEPSVSPSGEGSNVNIPIEGGDYSGWYGVTWTVISSDGHQIQDTFTFSVGAASAGPVPDLEIDDPTEGLRRLADPLRGLSYLVTLLAIGSLTALWSVRGTSAQSERIRRRLRRWTLAAAGAGLLLIPATLLLNAVILNGGSTENLSITTRIVLQSSTGIAMLLRASALFGLCAAIPLLIDKGTRVVGWVVGAVAAVALTASYAMAGHTAIVDWRWISAAALVTHLVAAGMWIGALPGLGYVVLSKQHMPLDEAAATLKRFSYVATVSLIAVFVAGTALTVTMLNQVQDLWTTSYGITLSVKIGIVGIAALLGSVNHFLVVPLIVMRANGVDGSAGESPSVENGEGETGNAIEGPSAASEALQESEEDHQRHARRAIRAEAIFLALLVVATAWLTTSGAPKAGGSHAVHQGFGHGHGMGLGASLSDILRETEAKTFLTSLGDGEVQLDYAPGLAGQTNTLTFTPTDAKGKIMKVDQVAVELRAPESSGMGAITREAEDNGDGTWSVYTSDLGIPGFWTVLVTVKAGLSADEAEFEVEVKEASGIEGGS